MMHRLPYLILTLALVFTTSNCARGDREVTRHDSGYLEESPLPKGFPAPGPFDQVTRKSYPAYRAAVTKTDGPNRGFWTLFRHIKRQDIAMTAPVEMKMADTDDGSLDMQEMAFLYRHTAQGTAGKDGDKVEVLDLPAIEVLSYAWQGPRRDATIDKAKQQLLDAAKTQNLTPNGFRLLGYNSPSIPDAKKTHELQLLLK